MEQSKLVQIVVIALLLIIAIFYVLYSGRAEAVTLALGLSIWTLAMALLRQIGIGV